MDKEALSANEYGSLVCQKGQQRGLINIDKPRAVDIAKPKVTRRDLVIHRGIEVEPTAGGIIFSVVVSHCPGAANFRIGTLPLHRSIQCNRIQSLINLNQKRVKVVGC